MYFPHAVFIRKGVHKLPAFVTPTGKRTRDEGACYYKGRGTVTCFQVYNGSKKLKLSPPNEIRYRTRENKNKKN